MKKFIQTLNASFKLKDGRLLGYSESGDPHGFPIFYFHGFPGSRLQATDFHEIAHTKHCHLIGIDRPGMGLSSPNKQHTLLSWTNDIREFSDHLKIDKFSIIAHSGGLPFALACAHCIPERISHVALVSGMPPTTMPEANIGMPLGLRIVNFLARNVPGVSSLLMQMQRKILLKPAFFKKVLQQIPEPDRVICQDSTQMSKMILALQEAFKQGVEGAAYEFRLILKEWGFNMENIHTPISIWQGKLDKQVLVSHAEIYKRKLPNATLHLFDNEAHVSTLYNHMEGIIDSVRDEWRVNNELDVQWMIEK